MDWLVFLTLLGVAGLVWWLIRLKKKRRADAPTEANSEQSQASTSGVAVDITQRDPLARAKRDIPAATTISPGPEPLQVGSSEPAPSKRRRRTKDAAPKDYERLLFLDVETTGLSRDDRIVSIGMVAILAGDLIKHGGNDGYELAAETMHLIFNPQRPSNPFAQRVHGWSDEVLARQAPFQTHAVAIADFLKRSDVWIAHNLAFDLRFIRQEFKRVSQPVPKRATFCTMERAKIVWEGETAKLDQCIKRIGLARADKRHGALEDALLCAALYTHYRLGKTFKSIPTCGDPTNLR